MIFINNTSIQRYANMFGNDKEDFDREFLQLSVEYKELRAEIVERIKLRQQILVFNITAAGVIFGFAVQGEFKDNSNDIALIFPPISLFLALIWINNDYNIQKVSRYIRYKIERRVPGFGWEKFSDKMSWESEDLYIKAVPYISSIGVFIFSQIFALLIGSNLYLLINNTDINILLDPSSWTPFEFFGTIIAIISIVITFYFFSAWIMWKRIQLDNYARIAFEEELSDCNSNSDTIN